MNHFLFILPPHSKGMNGESLMNLNQLQFHLYQKYSDSLYQYYQSK